MPERRRTITQALAGTDDKTVEIDLGEGQRLVLLFVPAGLHADTDGIGFEAASESGGTFVTLMASGGTARFIQAAYGATGFAFVLPEELMKGVRFIKVCCLDGGLAEAQAGGDTFTLVCVSDHEARSVQH